MRGIKRPVDKRLLSGLFAILIQLVSFLQWRRNRLCRSYFFMKSKGEGWEGGREEDNWDECELYPKSDELLSKFLSSSLCFIQMPPKTLKIVWTEPSHVRFKERSKLLASVKVYNELKTVWDLKGSSNKNQTVTFVFIVGKRWDHVILFWYGEIFEKIREISKNSGKYMGKSRKILKIWGKYYGKFGKILLKVRISILDTKSLFSAMDASRRIFLHRLLLVRMMRFHQPVISSAASSWPWWGSLLSVDQHHCLQVIALLFPFVGIFYAFHKAKRYIGKYW